MKKHPSGIPLVTIFVAISRVRAEAREEITITKRLQAIFAKNPSLKLGKIVFKNNTGRDFSSHARNLEFIFKIASEDDLVLCLNRSAYGPLMPQWYQLFISQYKKYPGIGLCGITINFLGHPKRPTSGSSTHVQSYAFLTKVSTLRPYIGNFPGEHAIDRLDVITDGEIGLSQRLLERGYGLTCLAWPEHVFTREFPTVPTLPRRDIKKEVSNLPFVYRYPGYEMISDPHSEIVLRRIKDYLGRLFVRLLLAKKRVG